MWEAMNELASASASKVPAWVRYLRRGTRLFDVFADSDPAVALWSRRPRLRLLVTVLVIVLTAIIAPLLWLTVARPLTRILTGNGERW